MSALEKAREGVHDMSEDDLTLSTGKIIEANCGFIGLSPDLTLAQGYDGGINYSLSGDDGCDDLTHAEAAELAEIMISRWTQFKSAAMRRNFR